MSVSFICTRFLAAAALVCFTGSAHAEWFERIDQAMGTEVSVQFWADDAAEANAATDAIMAEMRRIDTQFSPYKPDSQLSVLNRTAGQTPVAVSDELAFLIARSLAVSKLTGGAFDISFSSVGQFYDYRKKQKPSDKQLAARRSAINYRHIALDRENKTVEFLDPAVAIDLGGIAKGYAVDRCAEILLQRGIAHARVSAGGDSRVIGDRRGRPWMTGIRNPRSEGSSLILPLESSAVSTSGDYERFFIDQQTGERHHHIISPKTGRSATGVQSVTIIAEDGITSDALSTSLFVLGVSRGLELVNRLPGVDAIFIDSSGLLHYSDDLQKAAFSGDS